MDDAGFGSEKVKSERTDDSKLKLEVEGEGWNTTIKFNWLVPPTPDEVSRQIDIKRAERDLKLVCIRHSEPSPIGWILAKIHYKHVEETQQQFMHLMYQLRDVGVSCMCAPKEQHYITTTLIKEVLADATRLFARTRRSEIALRLFIALLSILTAMFAFRMIFHASWFESTIDKIAHIPEHKTTLALVFFAGVSMSAWASYMQRSMSIIEWTPAKDLGDLRVLLGDPVHPTIRAIYIFTFAFIALLLFHLQVVQIKLGTFNTSEILGNFKSALFMGLMLGLAERTLPTAISRRARDLTADLSGTESAEHATHRAKAMQHTSGDAHGGRQYKHV